MEKRTEKEIALPFSLTLNFTNFASPNMTRPTAAMMRSKYSEHDPPHTFNSSIPSQTVARQRHTGSAQHACRRAARRT